MNEIKKQIKLSDKNIKNKTTKYIRYKKSVGFKPNNQTITINWINTKILSFPLISLSSLIQKIDFV